MTSSRNLLVAILVIVVILVILAILFRNNLRQCREQPDTRVYDADYIIVGAGSAGSVLAGRLIEAGHKVLVLEAGPDTSASSTDPNVQDDIPNIEVPLNFPFLWNRYNRTQGSPNCGAWESSDTLLDLVSENQYAGRYYAHPKGCGAGGSSAHNAMQDGRGDLKVYELISKHVSDPIYNAANSKARFMKMENYVVAGAGPNHGTNGWLHVRSGDTIDEVQQAFIDSAISLGVPYKTDFSEGEKWEGIGPSNVAVRVDGSRSHAYKDMLEPAMASNPGKGQVKFNCLVDKVVFEDQKCNKRPRAVGVKCYNKAYLQEFQTGGSTFEPFADDCKATRASFRNELPAPTTYYARREVIICGGAIQSPTILLRSGLGPKKHLEEVGIETLIDLQGVGSEISDHTELAISYEFDPEKYMPKFLSTYYAVTGLINGVTNPTILNNMLANANTNIFSGNTSQMQLDWYSGLPGLPFADLHMVPYSVFEFGFDRTFDTPYDLEDPVGSRSARNLLPNPSNPLDFHDGIPTRIQTENGQFNPSDPRVYVSWLVENLQPDRTEGTVRLKSADPRVSPLFDEKLYLDETSLERLAHGVKFVRTLMRDPTITQYAVTGRDFEFLPGPAVDTIEDIKEYIRNWSAHGHHVSSGCQMSRSSGGMGVVSSKMKVWGVDGLRVCDTSVYPPKLIHGFNTARGAYYMGETLAEIIAAGH